MRPGPGGAALDSSGERNVSLEPRGAGRRSARHRARSPAAAGSRRGADDGDLDDAAGLPQGGAGQQRDVGAGQRRLHRDLHGRRQEIRRHDRRAEPGREGADVDRFAGARRHAGRDDLLRLQGLRRRDVPRPDRADAGIPSGPGHHGLGGEAEPGGRSPRAGPGEKLHAAAGARERAEARRRRLLPDRRQPRTPSPSIRATTSSPSKRRPTKRARRRSSRRSRKRSRTNRSAT